MGKNKVVHNSVLLVVCIILVSTVIRTPLTAIGPLLEVIEKDLHISNTLAGTITTIPLICFGIFSLLAPKLISKFGMYKSFFIAMIILTIGIFTRSAGTTVFLFTGTIIIGIGIAIGNVLIPTLIKRDFPQKIGLMMGVYTVSMNVFGATASGISMPLVENLKLSWQVSLAIWGVLGILAVLVWIPLINKKAENNQSQEEKETKTNVWKSSLAWKITLMMGLQSLVFYSLVTWLPEMFVAKGMNADYAGLMLSILQITTIPLSFIISLLASRQKNQQAFVVGGIISYLIGIVGIGFGPLSLQITFVILAGIGVGILFTLSLLFFSIKSKTVVDAGNLSGMAQSIGYLIAATGPFIFGYLHKISNGWTVSILFVIVILLFTLYFGLASGKDELVSDNK